MKKSWARTALAEALVEVTTLGSLALSRRPHTPHAVVELTHGGHHLGGHMGKEWLVESYVLWGLIQRMCSGGFSDPAHNGHYVDCRPHWVGGRAELLIICSTRNMR